MSDIHSSELVEHSKLTALAPISLNSGQNNRTGKYRITITPHDGQVDGQDVIGNFVGSITKDQYPH